MKILGAFLLSIFIFSASSEAASIGVYPESIETKCGQSFTIGIIVNNAADLMGARLEIDFDSSSLKMGNYAAGDLLAADNANVPLFTDSTQTGMEFCIARFASSGSPGVSGNGTIATICFTPIRSGSTTIRIGDVDFRSSQNQSSAPSAKADAAVSIADIQISPNPYEADKAAAPDINISGLSPDTTLQIYTLSGELVERLEVKDGGAKWCVRDIASGVYFCVISSKDSRIVKKIGVIK